MNKGFNSWITATAVKLIACLGEIGVFYKRIWCLHGGKKCSTAWRIPHLLSVIKSIGLNCDVVSHNHYHIRPFLRWPRATRELLSMRFTYFWNSLRRVIALWRQRLGMQCTGPFPCVNGIDERNVIKEIIFLPSVLAQCTVLWAAKKRPLMNCFSRRRIELWLAKKSTLVEGDNESIEIHAVNQWMYV